MRTGKWLPGVAGTALSALALSSATAQEAAVPAAANLRDGQHDFDFNFGVWRTHIRRLREPVTGSPEYVEMNSIVTVRKVCGMGVRNWKRSRSRDPAVTGKV